MNNIIIYNTNGFTLRGVLVDGGRYSGIEVGGNDFVSNGSNQNITLEWCRITNQLQTPIHVGNGNSGQTETYAPTVGVMIRYCDFDRSGQGPEYNWANEGIYIGSGSYPYVNRVTDITIDRCTFDGTNMTYGGEAIDCKVYTKNLTVTGCWVKNWKLPLESVGCAFAILGNTFDTNWPSTPPTPDSEFGQSAHERHRFVA